jgi:S-adenosylhomocysteine hydrolase
VTRAARTVGADVVVLAATRVTALEAHAGGLRLLARNHRLLLAGRGAEESLARGVGAELLPADPVSAAEALASSVDVELVEDTEAEGA